MAAAQQFEQRWKDILSEPNEDKKELLILQMINQLLKRSSWENHRLDNLNKQDRWLARDFVIEHLEIANHTQAFFETARSFLDSDRQYRGIQNEIDEFKKRHEHEIAVFEKAYIHLVHNHTKLKNALAALQEKTADGVEQWLALNEKLISALGDDWNKIDERVRTRVGEIERLIQQYNQKEGERQDKETEHQALTAKLNNCLAALEEVARNVQKARELYEAHFSANERAGSTIEESHRHYWSEYGGKLEAVPEVTMREELKAMRDASERIKAELEKFDEALRHLLELGRNLRDSIRDLSEPGKTAASASA